MERRTALYLTQGGRVQTPRGPHIKGDTPEGAQAQDMAVLWQDWGWGDTVEVERERRGSLRRP